VVAGLAALAPEARVPKPTVAWGWAGVGLACVTSCTGFWPDPGATDSETYTFFS